jgi:hypothetical protein
MRVLVFTSQKDVSEVFNGDDGGHCKYAVELWVAVVVHAGSLCKYSFKATA